MSQLGIESGNLAMAAFQSQQKGLHPTKNAIFLPGSLYRQTDPPQVYGAGMGADLKNQTITLADGRRLGYAEYGDPHVKVVFHFNGSGGSRLEAPSDLSILTALEIRFISTDRPGHGISDPQPGRQLLDWPQDISQLANQLNIDRFYVQGWSAGGPHALACAHQLPEFVIAGAIISGLAPPVRPQPYLGLPFPNRILMRLGRSTPSFVYLFRRLVRTMIMGDPQAAGKKLAASFPEVDQQLILGTDYEQLLVIDIQEGYRQGWQGPAQDDILINSPWGFDLTQIKTRIDIWQGEIDKNVPLNQGQYQHDQLPNNRLRILPGQAHLYLLTHWHEVLSSLVS
jgi:pimeloyl-ACP methyl ester carboxylesterase